MFLQHPVCRCGDFNHLRNRTHRDGLHTDTRDVHSLDPPTFCNSYRSPALPRDSVSTTVNLRSTNNTLVLLASVSCFRIFLAHRWHRSLIHLGLYSDGMRRSCRYPLPSRSCPRRRPYRFHTCTLNPLTRSDDNVYRHGARSVAPLILRLLPSNEAYRCPDRATEARSVWIPSTDTCPVILVRAKPYTTTTLY
jgi:hypothetical protein